MEDYPTSWDVVSMPKNVPTPNQPQNWTPEQSSTLFNNISAQYLWRCMYTNNRGHFTISMWKKNIPEIMAKCWVKIVALYDVILIDWGQKEKSENYFNPDKETFTQYEHLYHIAMAKRLWRRKPTIVRQYQDIDEYVDNIYLNE
jgi:hypothetical protein